MPRTIRFHLDENCDPRIAIGLRRREIDVTTSAEAGLLQASDESHLAFCREQGRVLVTHDADFLRFSSEGIENPGIAYSHPEKHSLGEIIRRLILIWEVLETEEMKNHVEWV